MEASERVTWEDCPSCQRPAAVGWVNGQAVEFDCPGGCSVTLAQLQTVATRHRPLRVERFIGLSERWA
jgi:hypothetical protein